MFKMSATDTNTSPQAHLLLVNCIINQRLLKPRHTCSRCSSINICKPRIVSFIKLSHKNNTRGWAFDRVHNSCWPLDRLFALCDSVTLIFNLLTYY